MYIGQWYLQKGTVLIFTNRSFPAYRLMNHKIFIYETRFLALMRFQHFSHIETENPTKIHHALWDFAKQSPFLDKGFDVLDLFFEFSSFIQK